VNDAGDALKGYVGRILRVDLTAGETHDDRLARDALESFVGGSGLAAKLLWDEAGPEAEPLAPESPLIFMTGPLTGTRVPTSGRHAVTAKSPLTGIWGEADVGGSWGTALKRAGYDGIVVTGRSETPVYLWIHDGEVELRDASDAWGMDTYETDRELRSKTSDDATVMCIGPAGERLVRLAAILTDGKDARAAGRCGLGAVMGSKNLKAVVAAGSGEIPVARPDDLSADIKRMARDIRESGEGLHRYGTSGGMTGIEKVGDLPIRNWRDGSWRDGAKNLSGQRMAETILTGRYYCASCMIGCGRTVKVEKGAYRVDGAGPEYESLGMLGAMTLVDDLEAVAYATELCNRLGIDTISTGAAIAFAMEARENGLIDDDPGLALRWGSPEAVVELVRRIGTAREGLGSLLGNGVRAAAEEIGGIAPEFAVHVKGLEAPAHDPRAYNSVGVSYMTSNRGACHLQGFTHVFERSATMPEIGVDEVQDRFAVEGKGAFAARCQDLMAMCDSIKVCKFLLTTTVSVTDLARWLTMVTGREYGVDEFLETGERIYNIKRLYNVGCGVSRIHDQLPPRLASHRRRTGGAADNLPPAGRMLADYYDYRGWSEEGIPRPETVDRLGLKKYLDRLGRR